MNDRDRNLEAAYREMVLQQEKDLMDDIKDVVKRHYQTRMDFGGGGDTPLDGFDQSIDVELGDYPHTISITVELWEEEDDDEDGDINWQPTSARGA